MSLGESEVVVGRGREGDVAWRARLGLGNGEERDGVVDEGACRAVGAGGREGQGGRGRGLLRGPLQLETRDGKQGGGLAG